jgi:rare lipoprotein A
VEVTTIDPRTPQPLQQDPIRLAAAEPVPAELPEPLTIPEVVQASASMPGLFLQVGAFGNIDNAQRLKNRLETELQTAVLVEQHHKDNIPIYRVRVGPIESREVYDQLAHRLTGMGFPETRLVMQ